MSIIVAVIGNGYQPDEWVVTVADENRLVEWGRDTRINLGK